VRVALVVAAVVAIAAGPALADDQTTEQSGEHPDGLDSIGRIRRLMQDRQYAEARDLLLQVYKLGPKPELLFTLGQVEFNLEHFQAAIDYYQKFLDSNPGPDETALAQQAIGAARARLVAPPPKVIEREAPRPAYDRDWDAWSTSLVAVGGATAIAGTIVWLRGYRLGHEEANSTARLYGERLDRAKKWQWIGAGIATAGAVIAGAAFVRFAVHRVEVAPIAPGASPGAIGLALEHAW
jgi:tetratricopeptide (TPR) repeat protein